VPVHNIQITDLRPEAEQLAAAMERIQSARETVSSVTRCAGAWVIVTEKKQGRPPKETRVTTAKETR
jgi:hypothetical protein